MFLRSLDQVRSTLHQLVRDWSEEGAPERYNCYGYFHEELQRCLPVTPMNRNVYRVLVPGCGLARLPFECALAGYVTQGNEFSIPMLLTSDFILNRSSCVNAYTIYPWIHNPSNVRDHADLLRAITIPDVDPGSLVAINPGTEPRRSGVKRKKNNAGARLGK
jgi:carnosine N-methyltransferase